MDSPIKYNPRRGGALRTLMAALTLAILCVGVSLSPVQAGDRYDHDRHGGGHDRRWHGDRGDRYYHEGPPGGYYGPPPVVYAPPPPPPGIDFVFPLYIR
jgi:hypothetical protein